jgi:hypothetical protein
VTLKSQIEAAARRLRCDLMNTIINSDAWTGLAPYDVLTDYERTENMQFGASLKLLFGGAGASLFFCSFGVLLLIMELRGYQSGVAFFNWPIVKAVAGVLMIGLGLAIIPGWRQRWLARHSVVPLIITNNELRFGTPPRIIELDTITSVTFRGFPKPLSELARALSSRIGGSRNVGLAPLGPLRLSTRNKAEAVKLDLTTLRGDPSRIGLIICDRIQKLQSRTGNANV